jgi:multidrug efflux pump subunit AcrB
VHLRDVATIADGAAEPELYVFHAQAGKPLAPAVTLAVAKTRGANATRVAESVLARV